MNEAEDKANAEANVRFRCCIHKPINDYGCKLRCAICGAQFELPKILRAGPIETELVFDPDDYPLF